MKDTELYRQILGLQNPWYVDEVAMCNETQSITVLVRHSEGVEWCCPKCQRLCKCRDHAEERTWRHLDTCQYQTLLKARIPRVNCPEHGVLQVTVPWAEERSRFTLLMERLCISVLQQAQNITAACEILKISWDECWGIMKKAVRRGQTRKPRGSPRKIGIDEKSFKGGHHSYMTIVYDLENSSVEYVADDRRADSLDNFFRKLRPVELDNIEAIACDMWDPYLKSINEHVPNAEKKIVLDRFHVMKLVNTAVDEVRRKEQRELPPDEKSRLKGARFALLYAEENLPDRYLPKLEEIKAANLKVSRAWAMKESIRQLWEYHSEAWARKFFIKWYWWASHSRIKPMTKLAKTLKRYLDYIVSHARHQITNSVAEGINSKIMSVKRRACGFRNAENYKTAIYFYCGKLDVFPC